MSNVYPLKCRIRAAADVTRVDVYDDIGTGDWLGGGIGAADFAGQLSAVKGALDVHINSGGGDVFDGLAIAEAIRAHRGPVTTVVDGIAASIASVIAQAGQQRVVAPGSMVMIHDAFGATAGNAAEVAKFAATLDKVSANLAGVYAARAGGTPDQWRAAMQAETWYTADEAVAAGLADRVGAGKAALPDGLDLAAFAPPGRIAAALRAMPKAAAMHGDHERVDPDGDGDCDACPEGDTDHDYWAEDGRQLKPLPGQASAALTADDIRAIIRAELAGIRDGEKYSTDDRKRMASEGHAMPDGSYPIADAEDLDNAIHAVGRGGSDHDAIRRHIISRAKALGLSSRIPDDWDSDGSLKDQAAPALSAAGTESPPAGSGLVLTEDMLTNIQAALKEAQ